jgi:hypothetical protein
MILRFSLSIALLACLVLTTASQAQHAQKDLDHQSILHPEAGKRLAELHPAFNLTIEQIIEQGGLSASANGLVFSTAAGPDFFYLVEQISQNWDPQANAGQGDWITESRVSYTTNDAGIPVELLIEDWDATAEALVPSFRRVTNRNEQNQAVETLDEGWEPTLNGGQGGWEPLQRGTLTFNAQGRVVTSVSEFWDDDAGAYMIWSRSLNTYDSSGLVLVKRVFESALFGPLAPSILNSYVYDSNGNLTEQVTQTYDDATSEWVDWRMYLTTYDSNGEEIEDLRQDWDAAGSAWVNGVRTVTMFTPNSATPSEVDEVDQMWDVAGGAWVNEDRNTVVFVPNGSQPTEVVDTDQTWDPTANGGQGDWLNEDRDLTMLESNRPVSSLRQTWDAAWVDDERGTFGYDENDLIVSALTENWDGAGWVNESRLLQKYKDSESTAVESDEVAQSLQLHSNYPNPFSDVTTIDFTMSEAGHVRLEVFDMLGRSVSTLVDSKMTPGRHRVTLEAADLPGGLYLYRLDGDRFRTSRTMLLVK